MEMPKGCCVVHAAVLLLEADARWKQLLILPAPPTRDPYS